MVSVTSVAIQAALAPSYRDAVLADSPRGYWRLGDWSGTAAQDVSTVDHSGVYTNGPTLAQTGALLTDGDRAVSFNGSDEWVNISGNAAYDVDDTFSIELWIKLPAGLSATKGLFGYQDTTNVPALQITSGEAIRLARRTGTSTFDTIADSTVSISDTNWHHVVWSKTGATNVLYIDGVDRTGSVTNQTITTGTTPALAIGVTNTSVWDGCPCSLDEVALYNTPLTAARVAAHYAAATTWTDLSADVRRIDGITLDYGIRGGSMADRVASSGGLTFSLRNDAGCSGGVAGYYSPHHLQVRTGWTYNVPIRLAITYDGTSYYWLGRLDTIDPVPGRKRERSVRCTAVDWMDDAARAIGNIPIQLDKRGDEIFMALIACVGVSPMALDVQTSPDTYPYGADNITSDTQVLSGMQSLAMSGLDYIGCRRDTTYGQTVFYENRFSRPNAATPLITLNETMHDLSFGASRSKVTNIVMTTVYPRRVDTTDQTIIATLYEDPTIQQPSSSIGPTESVIYWLDYTDPVQRDSRIGAKDQIDPDPASPYFDYTMNTLANGTGTDLTADFVVTASFMASAVKLTVRNNSGSPGFVTKLQVRGRGIYSLNPVVAEQRDAASIRTYGEQYASLDMLWQSDPNVGFTSAAYLLNLYSNPLKSLRDVTFLANASDELMTAALVGDVSDRIAVSESMIGIDDVDYHIQRVRFNIASLHHIEVAWTLASASETSPATARLAATGRAPTRMVA